MDFVNKLAGGDSNNQQQTDNAKNQESSSGGGFMDKINSMAGGGQQGEKNEDYLDKGMAASILHLDQRLTTIGVDFVQEKVLGQGDQSNESAVEQAKDEQISDFIRGKYKDTTGKDFPVEDKV